MNLFTIGLFVFRIPDMSSNQKNSGDITDDGDSSYSEIEGGGDPYKKPQEDDDTFEITQQAAIGFILLASCMLMLFFFFDLHILVLIIYILGATCSIAIVFFHPSLLSELSSSNQNQIDASTKKPLLDNGDCIFILSMICSAVITGVWYFNRAEPWAW